MTYAVRRALKVSLIVVAAGLIITGIRADQTLSAQVGS
jgi:hypothetical protein